MTRSPLVGEMPSTAVSRAAERVLVVAPVVFLVVAPFAGSSGLRTTCLMLAAAAIGWLAWRRHLTLPRPPAAMVVLFAAWSLLAVASLAWTVRPDYSLSELRVEIVYVALTMAVFFIATNEPRRWRTWCFAILSGIALALLARVLHEDLGLKLWRHPPDGGAGPYSTYLVLAAAILPVIVLAPPWGMRRGAFVFGLAWLALFFAAWSTGNRIVWPSLLAVLVITLVAGRRVPGLELASWRALGSAVAVAGLLVATAFAASVAERSDQFFRQDARFTASVERDIRPRLWKMAWSAWQEAPWLGHGFGREILERRFLPETPPVAEHPQLQHAHNTFLNVALELGAVGLAIFVALLLVLMREYLRMLSRPRVAMLGVVGLAMLGGFLVKNLTDDFFYRHNALVFWALNAALVGFASRAAGEEASLPRSRPSAAQPP